ncbi:MAG: squalene--hopene cyclase [Planctomycetaceae bacterium]|nr:squalene--hopene cyclase [Planctomycetaceae bacterium]
MHTRLFLAIVLISSSVFAAEELTLENVTTPTANSSDEPLADAFSLDASTRFLDQASLDWTKSRKCFACHTNFSYLISRPTIDANVTAQKQVRVALEEMVEQRWEKEGPRWDAEVVMSAAVLAINDAATSGKLHATTSKALKRMWTVQREDGGFEWLKCGWPPMESDDDYGIAIAALAIGAAPDGYAQTPEAQQGLAKLKTFLKNNPAPTLHHQAMLLWAESYGLELLTPKQRNECVEKLLVLQKKDGGWAFATFGDWERGDGKEQDTETSDGYATGFAIFALRCSGVKADDARLSKGIAWLKANQRASGRWYTRSLNKDSKHFISHAGTAFAVMAIASCKEQPSAAGAE